MNHYTIPAKPVGPYASKLEAQWAKAFAGWGLSAKYVGDVVAHFDFAMHVGRALVAAEVKPLTPGPSPAARARGGEPQSPAHDFIDEAVRRFARHRIAHRLYDWSLPSGRVPDERLLLVAGEPAEAEWWFAAEIAAGVWNAVRVGPPVLVLSGGAGGSGLGAGDLLKWPVDGGARHAVDPMGSWLAEARRGRETGRNGRPTPAEAAAVQDAVDGYQRRLFT